MFHEIYFTDLFLLLIYIVLEYVGIVAAGTTVFYIYYCLHKTCNKSIAQFDIISCNRPSLLHMSSPQLCIITHIMHVYFSKTLTTLKAKMCSFYLYRCGHLFFVKRIQRLVNPNKLIKM